MASLSSQIRGGCNSAVRGGCNSAVRGSCCNHVKSEGTAPYADPYARSEFNSKGGGSKGHAQGPGQFA